MIYWIMFLITDKGVGGDGSDYDELCPTALPHRCPLSDMDGDRRPCPGAPHPHRDPLPHWLCGAQETLRRLPPYPTAQQGAIDWFDYVKLLEGASP
jgi:hypothetical protein